MSNIQIMVLILDGKPELGANVRSNLCYLICLGHFSKSTAVTIRIFYHEKTYFPSCMCNFFVEFASNKDTMVLIIFLNYHMILLCIIIKFYYAGRIWRKSWRPNLRLTNSNRPLGQLSISIKLMVAVKKVSALVVRPLREGGGMVKAGLLRKKNFFWRSRN